MRLRISTIPVLNHQMNIAKSTAMAGSVICNFQLDAIDTYQTGAMRTSAVISLRTTGSVYKRKNVANADVIHTAR